MLVPSLRVPVGQNRGLVLDGRQLEYTQYVESLLEQEPFAGVINLHPLVDVPLQPAQRFEIGHNFFSPEQLQAANNCSAYWGDCYDGAAVAQNFWIVRREETRILEQVDALWPIPAGPDHAMHAQWRRQVWIETMHWFHLQRRLRWGLPPPRPLDATPLNIPRLNPDAPPPQLPTSETRAYMASLPIEPGSDTDHTGSAGSTPPTVIHTHSLVPVPGPSSSSMTTPSTPEPPSPSGLTGAERHAWNRRVELENRRRGKRPAALHSRDHYRPMNFVSEDFPLIRQPPVLAPGERMRRTLYGNRMRATLGTSMHVRAPPPTPTAPTPTAVAGTSSIPPSIPNPNDLDFGALAASNELHFGALAASLKRALPNASVTASCLYVADEVSPNSVKAKRAALADLEDTAETFRTTLADLIAGFRDHLRRQESAMLTDWEDEHRAMDAEDADFDRQIHETLGLGPSPQSVATPQRHQDSYWVSPPSSASLSAPPPSLKCVGFTPSSYVHTSLHGSNAHEQSHVHAFEHYGEPWDGYASHHSSRSIHDLDFATLSHSTTLQYDTACLVDWRVRGRQLEFDVRPGDSSASTDTSQRPRSAGGGPVIFYEEEDVPLQASQRLGDAEHATPDWDWSLPAGDVEMHEHYGDDADELPDVDTNKVIGSSFYRDLARDLSVDAPMDRALVRALETIDASTEANMLNKVVDSMFEKLG
ncbi:hypothetical protein BDZ89DRAFT_1035785 [Hymenopellis radicata]|nr:hypothetical protein BDZ89DRAFT_1035785 [Hymenopellis radicata]